MGLCVVLTDILLLAYPIKGVHIDESQDNMFIFVKCRQAFQNWYYRPSKLLQDSNSDMLGQPSIIFHTNLMYIYY
jgi:hypothetical protein